MRVARLFRFPVKGFPAEELTEARVVKDRGIRGDRVAAFTNGSLDVPDDAWHSYSAFTVLKNDTELQKWRVAVALAEAADVESATVTLTDPAGESTTFATDDRESRAASARFLSERIPPQGDFPRGLAVADQGMFDSQKSGISLINPATVAAIADTDEGRAALGAAADGLDPLRFRGNVLLDGLEPFAEFALVGSIIRLGGVRLAIRSTIERCPATTVNPRTTAVDVNVPRVLNSACGHLHCGIYGQILETGEVAAGDEIVIEGPAPRELIKVARSPRFMTVVGRQRICNDIVEVALRDDLGWIREFDEPGTNLRVHLDLGAPFCGPIRSPRWTTTSSASPCARRAEAHGPCRARGRPTHPHLRPARNHDRLPRLRRTTALVTAGIGITPSLGLLRPTGSRTCRPPTGSDSSTSTATTGPPACGTVCRSGPAVAASPSRPITGTPRPTAARVTGNSSTGWPAATTSWSADPGTSPRPCSPPAPRPESRPSTRRPSPPRTRE
jgi:uncharacterized protein YcbX